MKIEEFLEMFNLKLTITYLPDIDGNWCATCSKVEVIVGKFLICPRVRGNTPEEALKFYAEDLKGKMILVNNSNRYKVPESLSI